MLGKYESPSIKLTRTMYDDLTMPWQVDLPVNAFPQEGFKRYEWNPNGALGDGEEDFYGGSEETTLDELRDSLGTASMVTQWREDNPHIAGTDRDCVQLTMKEIASALGSNGLDTGKLKIKIGSATTLLIFRRTGDIF
jgi:trans-aconitate 3-methyltransferase